MPLPKLTFRKTFTTRVHPDQSRCGRGTLTACLDAHIKGTSRTARSDFRY